MNVYGIYVTCVVLSTEHVGDAPWSCRLQRLYRLHLVRELPEQKKEVIRGARRRWNIADTRQDIQMGLTFTEYVHSNVAPVRCLLSDLPGWTMQIFENGAHTFNDPTSHVSFSLQEHNLVSGYINCFLLHDDCVELYQQR